jgi:hypothetical protein
VQFHQVGQQRKTSGYLGVVQQGETDFFSKKKGKEGCQSGTISEKKGEKKGGKADEKGPLPRGLYYYFVLPLPTV